MGAAGNTIGGHQLHLASSHESTLGENREGGSKGVVQSIPAQHRVDGSHGNLRSTAMYKSYSLGLMSGSGREKN